MKKSIMQGLHTIENTVIVALALTATVLLFGNAMARYVFQGSLHWAEEVVRLIFVWSMFLAITTSFIRNEHIGFHTIVERNVVLRLTSTLLYDATLATVGGVVLYHGKSYNRLTGAVPLAGNGLPTALFLVPGVLAGAIWFSVGTLRFVRHALNAARKRGALT